MADTAGELSLTAWIDGMESVKGTALNPVEGVCRNCKEKIYRHQVILGTPRGFCSEDCEAEYEDK